jgi:hypothetical protein
MKRESLNERMPRGLREARDGGGGEGGKKEFFLVLKLISYSNDSYTNDQFIFSLSLFAAIALVHSWKFLKMEMKLVMHFLFSFISVEEEAKLF